MAALPAPTYRLHVAKYEGAVQYLATHFFIYRDVHNQRNESWYTSAHERNTSNELLQQLYFLGRN